MPPPVPATALQVVAKALPPVQAGARLSPNAKDLRAMKVIRCRSCNKKLGEGTWIELIIKCPRCSTLNQLKAPSLMNNGESHELGTYHPLDGRQTSPR
jgi:phage FluMu protein Com